MNITLEEAFKNVITCVDAYKCTKVERLALDKSVEMLAQVALKKPEQDYVKEVVNADQ